MTLKNDHELANSQRKLLELERLIATAKSTVGPGRDTEVRTLTRLANQLREEVMQYQAGASTPRGR